MSETGRRKGSIMSPITCYMKASYQCHSGFGINRSNHALPQNIHLDIEVVEVLRQYYVQTIY